MASSSWADSPLNNEVKIGLATGGILILELAIIRWSSSQIRAFAYFNNVVLISAFLGSGLGIGVGRRLPGLLYFVLPAVALMSLPFAFADSWHLTHLTFPDQSIELWGGTIVEANLPIFFRNMGIFALLIIAIIGVFFCAGAPLGFLFARLEPMRAYRADLLGSLAGIIIFSSLCAFSAGPTLWLAAACLPFLILSRSPSGIACTLFIAVLGYYSGRGAEFSPYNRISLQRGTLFDALEVNRDLHQYLHNLSDERLYSPEITPDSAATLRTFRREYDLPFLINKNHESALIVGAGTGNDVQAAIRCGYKDITSVDIDRSIIAIGRTSHPERPYSFAGVRAVVDDARAFFARNDERKYDAVVYGLLDSHAMNSAMSTLRLDNYVYTREGLAAGFGKVDLAGHLALTMSCSAGYWFFERIYWTVYAATGAKPLAFYFPLQGGTVTYVVSKPQASLLPGVLGSYSQIQPTSDQVRIPTDDWPFLYLRPGKFPFGYCLLLGSIILAAFAAARRVFGFTTANGTFDFPLFFMGAGFLLLETRGITSLSLLFGSTWLVNSAVFGGVVAMALLSNEIVLKARIASIGACFIMLMFSLVILYFVPAESLASFPFIIRGIMGSALAALPVGFAGLIVPTLLSRAQNPTAALGSNLLGAVVGGCFEYYAMYAGLRAVLIPALFFYILAYLFHRRAVLKQK